MNILKIRLRKEGTDYFFFKAVVYCFLRLPNELSKGQYSWCFLGLVWDSHLFDLANLYGWIFFANKWCFLDSSLVLTWVLSDSLFDIFNWFSYYLLVLKIDNFCLALSFVLFLRLNIVRVHFISFRWYFGGRRIVVFYSTFFCYTQRKNTFVNLVIKLFVFYLRIKLKYKWISITLINKFAKYFLLSKIWEKNQKNIELILVRMWEMTVSPSSVLPNDFIWH